MSIEARFIMLAIFGVNFVAIFDGKTSLRS